MDLGRPVQCINQIVVTHRHPTHWLVSTQVKVPVGAVWKLLPWNRGLPPTCAVEQVYLDDDVRIAKDTSGQYFVYARPV